MARNSKSILLVLLAASAITASGLASAAQPAPAEFTREQVAGGMAQRGYTNIRHIQREGELWTMTATGRDGRDVRLKVDARSGQVYGAPGAATTTAGQVTGKLLAAGYGKVQTLAFLDDGQWHAVVSDKAGKQSSLKIDDRSGRIIAD